MSTKNTKEARMGWYDQHAKLTTKIKEIEDNGKMTTELRARFDKMLDILDDEWYALTTGKPKHKKGEQKGITLG